MNEKETTALYSPTAIGEGQSSQKLNNSISDNAEDFKTLDEKFHEMKKEMLQQMDQSYLKTMSLTELYETDFDVHPALIEGILHRGTYLFAGSPKVGKSFFMAQLAYHISTGTPLWNFKVRKSTVLYFALEDDYARLQRRLFQMFGADGTENLYFATQSKTVNDGLEEQIKSFVNEHPDTGLIIIDTLKRVREVCGAEYSYSSDYDVVAKLKALADSYKVTMIIVHHTRKQKADDSFEMISGTNGLLGAADGAFILRKSARIAMTAYLDITGRDQQDMSLFLSKDSNRLVWELESVESELWVEPPDPLLERISTFLFSDSNRWDGTASELCKQIDVDLKPNVLSLRLSINAERLFSDYNIRYKTSRNHNGRKISLWKDEESVTMCDDRDKLSGDWQRCQKH